MWLSKMRYHSISDKIEATLILRFLGALIIIICLARNGESTCVTLNDLSTYNADPIFKTVETGTNVTLACCLKNNGNNSKLVITEDRYLFTVLALTRKNDDERETTVQLGYQKQPYLFSCNYDGKAYSDINVTTGSAKRKVQSLKCEAIDLLRINCIFEEEYDGVETNYSFFSNGTEISATKRNRFTYEFNITEFQYSTDRQSYQIDINSTNILGHDKKNETINQYKIAKPRLVDVKFINITSNSTVLSWKVPNSAAFEKYTEGLAYNISLIEQKSGAVIDGPHFIKNKNDNFWVEFSNLYSFYNYTVHLRIEPKSISNLGDEFKRTFETSTSKPDTSHEIGIGSFCIHSEGLRNYISLFWKPIPENRRNGPNFTYELKIKENGNIIKPSIHMDENIVLAEVDFNNTSQYEFKLQSRNKVGPSEQSSVLKINPLNTNISDEHRQAITKLYNNQTYTVSWLKPVNFTALSSFTLFWCNRNQTHDQCNGPIDFIELNKTTLSYTPKNISNNAALNFALSENYNSNTYSSGMVWAKCYKDVKTETFQLVIIGNTSTENSITIQWKAECWHKTIIDKYLVKYCEDNTKQCYSETINKYAEEYKINELKPSTKYNINITPILKPPATNKQQESEPYTASTQIKKDTAWVIFTLSVIIIGIAGIVLLVKRVSQMSQLGYTLPDEISSESGIYNPDYIDNVSESVPFPMICLTSGQYQEYEEDQKIQLVQPVQADQAAKKIDDRYKSF